MVLPADPHSALHIVHHGVAAYALDFVAMMRLVAADEDAARTEAERRGDPPEEAPLGLVVRALELLLDPAMDVLASATSSRLW